MKRKKKSNQSQPHSNPPKAEDKQGISLGDVLDKGTAEKLKTLKNEKEQEIVKEREEEAARKLFEQKQREKNKTFEELLDESNIDWKKFK